MIPFLAALCTVMVLGGLVLVVAGLRKTPVAASAPKRRAGYSGPFASVFAGESRHARRNRILALSGIGVGIVVYLLSHWLVALFLVPVAFVGIPMLLMASEGQLAIRRIEAMEEWTRSLSGVLGAGVGLEQAIQATLSSSTPAAIRPEVATLVARLHARWSTTDALRAFAEDLDDATADGIVAGLILAAERRGSGLATMLEGTAERAAEDVRNRRRVEADLAKPRATARWVTVITIVVLGLMALNGSYIAPYGTGFGQVILVVLLAMYVAALLWMRQMAKGEPIPRFLGGRDIRDDHRRSAART